MVSAAALSAILLAAACWHWPKLAAAALVLGVAGVIYLDIEIRRTEPELVAVGVRGWTVAALWIRLLFTIATKGMAASQEVNDATFRAWKSRPGYSEPAPYDGPRSGAALVGEIGTWPKVTHTGRGGYLIEASFSSPRRAAWPGRLGVVTGIVLLFMLGGNIYRIAPGLIGRDALAFGVVAMASFLGGAASQAVWRLPCRVNLKIRVEDGGATWRGQGWAQCRILPNEDYEGLARQHHLAGEEIRVQNENIRRGATGPKTKTKPAYQVSSEVVFRTGARKQIEWPVAEIMPDIGGSRAGALAAALDLALAENRRTVEAAQIKQRAGRTGDGGRFD